MDETAETKDRRTADTSRIGSEAACEGALDGLFGFCDDAIGGIGEIVGGAIDGVSIDI